MVLQARPVDCAEEKCNSLVLRISADLAAEQAAGEDKFSMDIVLRRSVSGRGLGLTG